MRRNDGAVRREQRVVRRANRRKLRAVHGRHVDVRMAREALQGVVARWRVREGLERPADDLLALAHHDGVGKGRERQRIGVGERAAHQDERLVFALVTLGGDTGGVEHAHQPGQLYLVGHAEGDDVEVLQWTKALVADRPLELRTRPVATILEEDPLAGKPGRLLDGSVDALVAERAHPHRVRRRVRERDPTRSVAIDPPHLVGEAAADHTGELLGDHAWRQYSGTPPVRPFRVGRSCRCLPGT